jgi:hypothetical protein
MRKLLAILATVATVGATAVTSPAEARGWGRGGWGWGPGTSASGWPQARSRQALTEPMDHMVTTAMVRVTMDTPAQRLPELRAVGWLSGEVGRRAVTYEIKEGRLVPKITSI